jgi:hypothetical protein
MVLIKSVKILFMIGIIRYGSRMLPPYRFYNNLAYATKLFDKK